MSDEKTCIHGVPQSLNRFRRVNCADGERRFLGFTSAEWAIFPWTLVGVGLALCAGGLMWLVVALCAR